VPASLPLLNALSQVGLVIFMFLVGLRLDLSELYNLRSAATSTALLSIILPFSAGVVLSRELPPSPRHPRRVCHSRCSSRFDEHYGIPGSGPHPIRSRPYANPPWTPVDCLRGV